MYIDEIKIQNFRTFRDAEISFLHADREWADDEPVPKLKNVNLLLGDNGLGKTTLLKAISLAALGPAVGDSGIYANRLVRREPESFISALSDDDEMEFDTVIEAKFHVHPQDEIPFSWIESLVKVSIQGDLERMSWEHEQEKAWYPIFSSASAAFFFVGYGASRRVEASDQVDLASRGRSAFVRAQRIKSLFEESYSLMPLSAWLPSLERDDKDLFAQVVALVNTLMGEGHYEFAGKMVGNDYVFTRGGLSVPFPALSDGYRAYLGWISDLLYHISQNCPRGEKLVENHGIVMIDEIDLHIHPRWQVQVLPLLSTTLPNIQFIVTSHSPLIAGSLEWMNIIVMEPDEHQSSKLRKIPTSIHGLDADQILLTEFFGMQSTRAPSKEKKLDELTNQARKGDLEAAKALLKELSTGMEE